MELRSDKKKRVTERSEIDKSNLREYCTFVVFWSMQNLTIPCDIDEVATCKIQAQILQQNVRTSTL